MQVFCITVLSTVDHAGSKRTLIFQYKLDLEIIFYSFPRVEQQRTHLLHLGASKHLPTLHHHLVS